MSITKANATDYVTETIGGTPAVVTALAIINNAGRAFTNMRDWAHLRRPATTLSLVQNQAYVDLPADLGQIHALTPAGLNDDFNLVTREQFANWQRGVYGTPLGYVGQVSQVVDAGTNALTKRLELYPTPSAAAADWLRLEYSAKWTEITTAMDDTDVLVVPEHCEPLFYEILEAVAKGMEEPDTMTLSARLDLVRRSSVYQDALKQEARDQHKIAPIPRFARQRRYSTVDIDYYAG